MYLVPYILVLLQVFISVWENIMHIDIQPYKFGYTLEKGKYKLTSMSARRIESQRDILIVVPWFWHRNIQDQIWCNKYVKGIR